MKKLYSLLIFAFAILNVLMDSFGANAQTGWTQKANFGGQYRNGAGAFTIGTKGYISCGSGSTTYTDLWEWDQPTNAWTQKATINMFGLWLDYSVGFSIGTKGYIATGMAGSSVTNYYWVWDQSTNTWTTQQSNFSGTARQHAVGFSIGTKGYIGTGANTFQNTFYNDFWEYNQSTNTWTQKASFTGAARAGAAGFSIGTKGYIGTGSGASAYQDFYEYDQSANTWAQKANFPLASESYAVGFSIGTNGYIGTGTATGGKQFYQWNQSTNTWKRATDFAGTGRTNAIGFSIGTKGYIGTAKGSNPDDFWEYDPSSDCKLIVSSSFTASATTVNQGATVTFTNASTGATSYNWLNNGNSFSTSANSSYTYTTAGTYTVSLVSINGGCSDTSKQIITVNCATVSNFTASSYTVNTGNTVTFTNASTGATTYSWLNNGVPFSTSPNPSYTYTAVGTYTVSLVASNGNCSNTKNIIITVQCSASSNFTASATNIIQGTTVTLTNSSTGAASYSWLYNGTPFSSATDTAYAFNTAGTYTISLVATNGFCSTTKNIIITVQCAAMSSFLTSKDTVAQGDTIFFTNTSIGASSYSWLYNGTPFSTSTDTSYIFNTAGTYSVSLVASNGSCNTTTYVIITVGTCVNWLQKANFFYGRFGAVGFSIGTKGYIGTGDDNITTTRQDLWEWDQATNVWTQKANFGGNGRNFAVGFSIGTKGYIGTGLSTMGLTQDFWEWDQATNVWTQKATLPGVARFDAVGFSIGTKGYIGTGRNGSTELNDFWEWDQSSNTWTQKANFGGTSRQLATGFSIGTYGYIGTGYDGAGYKQDFWEWNQSTNVWTPKLNFPGAGREGAVGFSKNGKGYIGTGGVGNNPWYKDFWEWDQATNIWTQKANFGGVARQSGIGFSIGNKGYIGTGQDVFDYKDFWEYNDVCVLYFQLSAFINSTNLSCNGQCNGTATANPSGGTPPYTYAWSNSKTTQTITGLCAGSYTITVKDVNNATITATVSLTQPTALTTSMSITNASSCITSDGSITATISGGTAPYSYSWSNGQTTATATGLVHATYTVTVTDAHGCTKVSTATVNCPTGVAQLPMQNAFTIYPNPSTGIFILNSEFTKGEITIYNLQGEKIYSSTINSNKSEIDLSKQANGLYFLQLKTGQGIANKKLIINR